MKLALAALLSVSTASAQAPGENFDVFCGATHCIVKKEVLIEIVRAKSPLPCRIQTKDAP